MLFPPCGSGKHAIEHAKQHLVLWYSQSMRGYVEEALGEGTVEDYGDNKAISAQVDKLFALSSQHVTMDAELVFSKVMPILQLMAQQAAQYKPQPPMEPGDKVLLDTSMAETQRRAQRDQMEMDLKNREHDDEMLKDIKEQQIKVALNSVDNLTDERIKSAEISHDAAILQHEQEKTAISVLQAAQDSLGGQNGE